MGKIAYTKSQETAIRYKGGNLLLSAAAGSGKTATLTARILQLLLEGDENGEVNLTDMLAVTYTRAAASELRGRISAAILEKEREWRAPRDADERPGVSRNRLFRCVMDVQRADISTIHSFLYKTLRPYFPALGFSPDTGIIDESANKVVKADVMQDVIDDYFDRETAAGDGEAPEDKATFFELADALGAARDSVALDATLIGMADELAAVGRDEKCLYDYADVLDADAERGFFRSVYGEYVKRHIGTMLRHYRTILDDVGDELLAAGGKPAERYGPALTDMIGTLFRAQDAVENGDYSAVRTIVSEYRPTELGRLLKKEQTETSEYFKIVRTRFKKDMETLAKQYFTTDEATLTFSMRRTARILRKLGDALGTYYRAFAKRKRAQNVLDYADLELCALKLFLDENGEPTSAAKEVGGRYRYIFIDEYQDTNRVQDAIFRAISGKSTRFMVGDIKQSIYRFRGAEPDVFSGYRDRWSVLRSGEGTADEQSSADDLSSAKDGRCVFMSENFRCDEPVVRFVNMVSEYMFPFGGIPYTEDDALIYGKAGSDSAKTGASAPVELCLIEASKRKTDDDGDEEESDRDGSFHPEAEYVADRIVELLNGYLVDGERPCRASDIAILTRSLKGTAEIYGEALMRRGIPVRMKARTTPLSAKSAKLALCLLNLTDNPLRDIYTAGAMRSPVFGFTIDDIALLKRYGGDAPLYMALTLAASQTAPEESEPGDKVATPRETETFGYGDALAATPSESATLSGSATPPGSETPPGSATLDKSATSEETVALSPALVEKCVFLARWVKRHKEISRGMKADRYLELLYNELELSSLPEIFNDATERNALNRLYELARRYESGRFGGLSGFIEYMNENAEEETTEAGEENAVSIVSIHASKGLEYPVCFLVECGKKRNQADEQKRLLFDPVLGFGMTLPDAGGLVKCDTAVRRGIAEKIREDAVNEEMRVLYVAMTRARSRLIITAKTSNAEALLADAAREREYFTEWSVRECKTYRDILVRAAARCGERDFYRIKVVDRRDIQPYIPEEPDAVAEPSLVDEPSRATETDDGVAELEAALRENFAFRYPFAFLSRIPSKLAVSDLRPSILDEEETAARPFASEESFAMGESSAAGEISATEETSEKAPLPSFMTGVTEIKGADRGTATHLFMQFMDLERLYRLGVDAELERLVRERFLSPQTAALADKARLERFAESDLFRRMREAKSIRREFRFNVRTPAERFTTDAALAAQLRENDVRVTVQGVVDCVFREEQGLVLVDYKTDAMTREEYRSPRLGEEKLLRRHRAQLTYYKEICARLFGEEIAETLIYSTVLGRTIPVE